VKIRLALPEDAAGLASVHVRVWRTAYRGIIDDTYLQGLSAVDREAAWNKRLADQSMTTILAEEGERPIGFVAGGKSRDSDDPPSTAEIYSIYIENTYSRRGIGSALFQKAVERLKRSGFKDVILWVLSEDASARAFYEKQEMQSKDGKTRQIAIGRQALTEIHYRLSIKEE
jgi:ribosomal protein S18 acetylase RimI-like enzyme